MMEERRLGLGCTIAGRILFHCCPPFGELHEPFDGPFDLSVQPDPFQLLLLQPDPLPPLSFQLDDRSYTSLGGGASSSEGGVPVFCCKPVSLFTTKFPFTPGPASCCTPGAFLYFLIIPAS